MKLEIINPNIALNKAYAKLSLNRDDIELFKKNLIRLFARINESESEEHNKNIVSSFLTDTFYKTDYEINTAGRKDLVIHLGKSSSEPVAVIIEAKRPDDKAGMIINQKANVKSVHELIHYYLHERHIKNNKEIRYLIITDIYQWYIFDASEFEKFFFNNKQFVKTYKDWHDGVLPSKNTDWFYQEIAKPFIDKEIQQINCTYFNLREYEAIIKNEDKTDDTKLIQLYKLLSPQHLLKLPYANDSNVLNKNFYNELLHIIGLCEVNKNGKKTIERLSTNDRNEGSLIENTISILKTYDKLANIEKPEIYGNSIEEQLFSVGLELSITWLNRILFLKLLEGQLIKYNNGNEDFAFLNLKTIKDFDELSELFFDVLAVKTKDRTKGVKTKYFNIPYLNSALFEISELEKQTIAINQLKDRFELPIFSTSVLKELSSGVKLHGNKSTLEYLFEFLDSYNFASENSAIIQEQNKTIINASVLGLIFEKINGYKDGSFFTPGFITMYICKETIQKTVLQKFNSTYNWNCQTVNELYNELQKSKIAEYNSLINSIRICDPAVGSGHFLVSALNAMIEIKSELGILTDRNGKTFRYLSAKVVNDELAFYNDEEEFIYTKPKQPGIYKTDYKFGNDSFETKTSPEKLESQRIQETIFHEKQTIIENCLFGVDINQKSVQICRLRLWIELLKHSYYTQETNYTELETLPNIDINIKCGNSLVSRFGLNGSGFSNGEVQKMQLATRRYKDQVVLYKSTTDKATRKKTEKEIERIKMQFSEVANPNDEDFKKLRQIDSELKERKILYTVEDRIQEQNRFIELSQQFDNLDAKYKEKLKSLYGNAFEWRFEFPEILDDNGNFVGFDLVIGNPPYGAELKNRDLYKTIYPKTSFGQIDSYKYFVDLGFRILKSQCFFSFITSDSYLEKQYFKDLRTILVQNSSFIRNIKLGDDIFEEANIPTAIFLIKKDSIFPKFFEYSDLAAVTRNEKSLKLNSASFLTDQPDFEKSFSGTVSIIDTSNCKSLIELYDQVMGVKVYQIGKGDPKQTNKEIENDLFISDKKIDDTWLPFMSQGIKRYFYEDKHEYIKYGKWLAEPRDLKYFKNEKIVIREIINPFVFATYVKETFIVKNIAAVIIAKKKNYKLKYLLALINSKLFTYYILEHSPKNSNKSYPSFTSSVLKNLPIKLASKQIQDTLENLVDKILEGIEMKADVSNYNREIDKIVYKLYNVNDKEQIDIIENYCKFEYKKN